MDENQANLQIQKLFEFHQQGDFANVLKIALQLQKHFPNFALSYKAAGVALNALNRKAEAVLQMKKAVKLDPNDDETLSNLGQIFVEIAKNKQKFKTFFRHQIFYKRHQGSAFSFFCNELFL